MRWLSPILLLAGALFLPSACTPPREAPNRLVIWHQKTGAERTFFEDAIKRYNLEHRDENVVALYREGEELRNSFIIAAVAGQGPDLIFGPSDNVAIFAKTRVIRSWDAVVNEDFLKRFTAEGVVFWEKKPWLIADQIGNQLMLVYDRQAVEQPPKTLRDLVRLGRNLTLRTGQHTDRYAITWNYAEPYFFIPFLTGFGGWIMDADGNPTLDTPEMQAALHFILDLRDKYGLIPRYEDYDTANLMFLRRRAAMIINGPWSWAEYDIPQRNMLALLPINEITGLRCRPIVAAKGYSLCINTPATKFPMIRKLVAYLTDEEMQLSMATKLFTIPTLHSALSAPEFVDNPILQLAQEQAKYSIPMPILPQLRYIWDGIRDPYRKVITGHLSPEEGARLMQVEAERSISEGMQ